MIPNILTDTIDNKVLFKKIIKLQGYQEKTVNKFSVLPKFKEFYKTLPKKETPKKKFIIKKILVLINFC